MFGSHSEAAEAFCTGKLNRYYGDRDIIQAAITAFAAQTGRTCNPNIPNGASRYEPYALVVSAARIPDLPERITMAIYGMFTDGTMDRLLAGHFPEQEKNIHLDTLFRLNSIPAGVAAE